MQVDQDKFKIFVKQARWQLKTWDVDPLYPLLRRVYELRGLDPLSETALWHTFTHVNYYWISSVEGFLQRHWEPPNQPLEPAPFYARHCRKERRCVRGGNGRNTVAYFNDLLNCRPLDEWVAEMVGDGGRKGWRRVRDTYEGTVRFAGPWAGYKLCDLLKYTHGFDITADDMGQGSGASTRGPIASMALMTDIDYKDVTTAYEEQEEFYQLCLEAGIPFQGLEQAETVLCNHLSLHNRNYYIGRDLDDQLEQISHPDVPEVFWKSREQFDNRFRGEVQGWEGKRAWLNSWFRDHGILDWWNQGFFAVMSGAN